MPSMKVPSGADPPGLQLPYCEPSSFHQWVYRRRACRRNASEVRCDRVLLTERDVDGQSGCARHFGRELHREFERVDAGLEDLGGWFGNLYRCSRGRTTQCRGRVWSRKKSGTSEGDDALVEQRPQGALTSQLVKRPSGIATSTILSSRFCRFLRANDDLVETGEQIFCGPSSP